MAYFPNASAGDVLDAQCSDCPLGYGWNNPRQGQLFEVEREPFPCPTASVQMDMNYEQCKNEKLREAMSILISDDGTCKTRELLLKIRERDST
jgi:hypothetical protein